MTINNKILLLTLFLSAISMKVYCQPADIIFSQPLSGNQLIEATNSITFEAGFSYDASSSYQLIATIIPTPDNSNYTFTEPMESGSLQVNTDYPVGSINGTINIGPTGAANYVIPIDIPPGRNGMKPSLSLVYNSQAGEGLLGLGWSISGLSSITRIPTDFYHEGYIDPVDFDNNDVFALDGQRLIPFPVGGDQYRTENETFSKITLYGTSTNPTSFKVETKDGLELYYGNTIDSRVIAFGTSTFYAWNLNQVKDKNGNYYAVNYSQDGPGEIHPVSIEYSSNGSTTGDYTIEFGYETRSAPIVTFINGSLVQINKLLNLITAKYGTTVVGKMQLVYSNFKMLEIIKFGKNNTRLNSTNVYWGPPNAGLVESSPLRIRTLTDRFQGDYNGDGISDLIIFSGNPDTCSLYLGNTSGQLQFFSSQILSSIYKPNRVYPGDFNGDGQEDLMIFRSLTTGYHISYLTFTGTSFIKIDEASSFGFSSNVSFFAEDFNGDKKTDLMFKTINSTLCTIHSCSFQFDGSTSRTPMGSGYINWGYNNIMTRIKDIPVDINGDGKVELMAMDQTLTRFYGLQEGTTNIVQICSTPHTDNTRTNLFGDFNGDGMTDIFVVDHYILTSKGNGYTTNYCPFYNIDPTYNNFYTGDMNGDGKSDIIVVGKGSYSTNPVTIKVYYSCGYSATLMDYVFQLQTYNPVSTLQVSPIVNYYDKYNRFGDYNGDGVTDFYYEDGLITRLFNTYRGRSQYFVSEIKNGFGYSNHITYSPITYDTVYNKGTITSYPVIKCQGPFYVVRSISIDNPDFTHSSTSYSYTGSHFHLLGKGFLGFEKVTSIDSTNKFKSINKYEYNSTYFNVSPKKSSIYTLPVGSISGEIVSDVTFTNAVIGLENQRYFPYVSSSIENNYRSGFTVTKQNTFDSNGNLISYREDFDDGSFNLTNYSDFSSAGTWVSAKPQTITNTRKHYQDTQSFSVTSSFTYYPTTGLVNTKTVGPLTSTYSYDAFGNLTNEAISDGTITRTNHLTYDSQNMFIWKSYNALDHVTERTYDYATGNVLTEKTPDNVVTEFTYDDFGTLTGKLTTALGQSQSITLGWTTGTRPLGSVYYKQITSSGAPTTKILYDAFGRELRTETTGFDGNLIYGSTVYNKKGQVEESSLPYKLGDTPLKKIFIYNKYGEKIREESTEGIISFDYSGKTIQVSTSGGQSSSKTSDSQGNTVSATDDAGTITNSYKSLGKPGTITSLGLSTSMIYDNLGRQISLADPNAGITTYEYDNWNQLTRQINANGEIDSLVYDILGRVAFEARLEGTKIYTYDPSGNPGLLESVSYTGGSVNYTYDNVSRLTERVENVDETNYSFSYGYDSYSRLQTYTYPSGFAIKNVYNNSGYHSEVRRNDNNSLIWQGQNINAFGQYTQYTLGNNLTTTKTYNCLGMLSNITTGSVQNMDYSFDSETGNLTGREDNLNNLIEIFSYDDLNRLTGVSGPVPLTMSYSSSGNILSKTSVGDYSYDSPKPHAVTSVTNPVGLIPTITQQVSYTSFNKVESIVQANLEYTLSYGSGDQRTISKLYDGGILQKTMYYIGDYEKEVKLGNNTRQLHYIAGGDGLAAVLVKNNGQDSFYYIHSDHLGSINVITDQSGTVVQNLSFDAWGRRRNPTNWTYNDVSSTFLVDRGFTGHEHLDEFALINMNGRVYDPVLARILSPDNFVQSPSNAQNFNRYSYCFNNPLIFTDPSGDFIFGSLFSMYCPGLVSAGVILDGALWSAGVDASIQGIKIALGKQSKFSFPELFGAAAGGATATALSFSAPGGYIPSLATGTEGNYSFKDYISYYTSKASYTSYSGMVSSFVSNSVENYFNGNKEANNISISMLNTGVLSYLSSIANSIFEFYTWDRLSIPNRISAMSSEFPGNVITSGSDNSCFGSTSLLDASIELNYEALKSRSSARWTMAHENSHVPDIKELIDNNWKNSVRSINNSEYLAYKTMMIEQTKYGISMNRWLKSASFIHKGGEYSYGFPKKYLFTFDLLKILRNYY